MPERGDNQCHAPVMIADPLYPRRGSGQGRRAWDGCNTRHRLPIDRDQPAGRSSDHDGARPAYRAGLTIRIHGTTGVPAASPVRLLRPYAFAEGASAGGAPDPASLACMMIQCNRFLLQDSDVAVPSDAG